MIDLYEGEIKIKVSLQHAVCESMGKTSLDIQASIQNMHCLNVFLKMLEALHITTFFQNSWGTLLHSIIQYSMIRCGGVAVVLYVCMYVVCMCSVCVCRL